MIIRKEIERAGEAEDDSRPIEDIDHA